MLREHSHCDAGRIAQFLDDRLAPDEQSQLERHVETCTTCRQRLEATAAEKDFWQEAAVHLRSDALDAESGTGTLLRSVECGGSVSDQGSAALRIADYFDPTDDPRMLGRFGGYEIVGIIGYGGMGVVLKGFESSLDRYVAIKLLSPHLATSGAARARFAREARAAAAVLHENVVAIHRVSEAKGLPFLVMPYVPGDSLQKRLDEQGPLQSTEILRIGMQVAAGLAAAHAQGLVHRDIKPGNILLDKGVERVTITDFGLARAADDASLTRSGVIAGTPQYMSPEQARGEPLDGRSDLFSLGSVLYAMCVGRPPFRAESAFGVLQRISASRPTPIRQLAPETPEWLCEIVEKLHAKEPARRFQSAGELAELLGRWLAHVQQPTVIPAPPHKSHGRRRAQIIRRIIAAVGVAIVGLCLFVAYHLPSPFGTSAGGEASQLPSPFGRGAGGEGGSENHAGTSADSLAARPHPSPLPEGEGTENMRSPDVATQALVDERTLQAECQLIRVQISHVESQWSRALPDSDGVGWKQAVADLRRRLNDLEKRIDHNTP